jgi:P-type Ca2+ transporter type 2C
VPAAEIVPGDLIFVEEGDTIPAEARLIHSTALQVAEAALTGESLPVEKDLAPIVGDVALGDQINMIFSGTAATYGHGMAVVTATGMHTEMGRIAGMLKEAPAETTPLQRELDVIGKRLGIIVIVIAVVMIVTILLVEDVRGISAYFDVLILGVAFGGLVKQLESPQCSVVVVDASSLRGRRDSATPRREWYLAISWVIQLWRLSSAPRYPREISDQRASPPAHERRSRA